MTDTTETFEPVDSGNVRKGDRLRFVTANNGFDGGDDVWRTGTVAKVTDKTVTVDCDDNSFGKTANLRKRIPDWNYRCVSRAITEKPARNPYDADHVTVIETVKGRIFTAVWVSDPAIDPADALENILHTDLPYEVEVIAEATRYYQTEGYTFSGWVCVSGGGLNDYGDPIPTKAEAMADLGDRIRRTFTR